MNTKVVGLDLGTHAVKVCELVTTFRNTELVGFASEPVEVGEHGDDKRPTLEAMAQAARRLLERRGLTLEPIYTAVPADYVTTLTLEFPFSQPKKIAQVLPFQLEELVPVELDELIYDYQVLKTNEAGKTQVLVAYVKRALFQSFIETLSAAGVDPKVVGIGATAYDTLLEYDLRAETSEPVAVLDLGHVHTELAIFDHGVPVLVRNILGGGLDVTRNLGSAFHVGMEQAERGKLSEGAISLPGDLTRSPSGVDPTRRELIAQACHAALQPVVREVKRSLVSHSDQSGRSLSRLYITGGASQLRGLPEYLSTLLGIDVIPFDPFADAHHRLPDESGKTGPYAAKAIAVATRAGLSRRSSTVNFRKGDFAYTGDFGFLRGRIVTLAAAALLVVLLAAMVVVTKKRVLQAEHDALTNQVRSLSKALLGEETDDVDRIFTVMMAADHDEAKHIPQESGLQLLADVSESIGSDISIELDVFEIDLERKKLELKGRTGSGGDVERLVEALERHRCFKNKVTQDKLEKTMDEKTKFRLTATSQCS